MALTATQIATALNPTLAADANFSTWLELAEGRTSSCFFGTNYQEALAYRTLHIGAVSKRNANEAGPLTGKKVGPVFVQFQGQNQQSSNFDDLSLTTYGQQLKSLIANKGKSASITDSGATFIGIC